MAKLKKSAKHAKKTGKGASGITKEMSLMDIIQAVPDSAEIMVSHGLHCIGCHASPFESLEDGASAHGMGREEIDRLVDEINRAAGKRKAKER